MDKYPNIKIEKGVPFTGDRFGWLAHMDVGDSVQLPTDINKAHLNAFVYRIYHSDKKKNGRVYRLRKFKNGNRIWRTK